MVFQTTSKLFCLKKKEEQKKKEWILFIFNLKNILIFSRNELARPVMGTIFLVILFAYNLPAQQGRLASWKMRTSVHMFKLKLGY